MIISIFSQILGLGQKTWLKVVFSPLYSLSETHSPLLTFLLHILCGTNLQYLLVYEHLYISPRLVLWYHNPYGTMQFNTFFCDMHRVESAGCISTITVWDPGWS